MTGNRSNRRPWPGAWKVAAFLTLCLGVTLSTRPVLAEGPDPNKFFEKQVRPILVEKCGECHGPTGKAKGGLRLISRESVLKGGDGGASVVIGKPEESLLLDAIRYVDEPKMPPSGKLSDREIEVLNRWVALGVPWPESAGTSKPAPDARPSFQITEEQRKFWSFQPIKPSASPTVKDASWARNDIDRYILSPLESRGLKPAPPADRRAFIRRATYDLTGLPPSPDQVEAFVADPAPNAYEVLIDRLLASPRYGERWGRHWLDLVRYTDSFDARIAGSNNEMDINDSYRYRDWVIAAFNGDMPYNQFVSRQIAGDLLPPDAPKQYDAEGTIATGMLAIGNWGGGDADKEKLLTDIADDQVDVVSRAFMGLTVACARCHDHKFDPISTKDYYGLAGIFFSSHILPNVGPKTNGPPMLRIALESEADKGRRAAHAARLTELDALIASSQTKFQTELARSLRPEAKPYVVAAWEFAHRPADQAKTTLEQFATSRNLRTFALRQWSTALGLVNDDPLLSTPVRNVLGRADVFGWRGETDPPVVLINTSKEEAALLTFKVPARSVTAHPGPSSGVRVEWTSPIETDLKITGRLVDTDPSGGDGVAWLLELTEPGLRKTLARGDIPNGGSNDLLTAQGGPPLGPVHVKPGQSLRLTILPKAEYTCDTTQVSFSLKTADGAQSWDLAQDLTPEPMAGNPHADRLGHQDVWRFQEVRNPSVSTDSDPLYADLIRTLFDPKADLSTITSAAETFQSRFDQIDAKSPFWPRLPADEAELPTSAQATLGQIRSELDTLRKNPPPPITFANGVQEGGVPGSPHEGVHDVKVHVRGSYSRLGDLVPRHFPVVLAGDSQPKIERGSGRLELANWLTSRDHPLTARVMANRIWQQHFGTGIVRTPSNFGKLGERPTHPELLDHLAILFINGGWSVKSLHRAIMLSSTYRQSVEADPATFAADPDNRLFGRMNRRRLDAESIRDSLLVASGKLDLTASGPSIRDAASPRRSVYLMTIRSDRSSFGPLFDAADPTAIVDTRTVSTVAPQALYLFNNAFVLDQARALATRLRAESPDDDARINRAYALLFGRPPTDDERKVGRESLSTFTRATGADGAWPAYCHVLLCTNEWIYTD